MPAAGSSLRTGVGTALSVGLTLGLLVGLAVVVVRDDGSSTAEPPTPAVAEPTTVLLTAPMAVTTSPPDPGSVVADRTLDVVVSAIAEAPVVGLELWADGQLVGAVDGDDAADGVVAVSWTPGDPGTVALLGRARDDQGAIGQAAPVWVEVAPDPAAGGDGGGASATSPGAEDEPTTGADGAATPSADSPRAVVGGDQAPPPPTAEVDDETCTIALAPAGEEAVLAALLPGSSGPVPVTDGPTVDPIQVPLVAGPSLWLAVVDGMPSPPVAVDGPDGCRSDGWHGDARIVDGRLEVDAAAELAYAYVAVGDGGWQRVPPADGALVPPSADGTFDLGGQLPPLDGGTVRVEAWGWSGGELVPLGEGELEPPTPSDGSTAQLTAAAQQAAVAGAQRTDLTWIEQAFKPETSGEFGAEVPEVLTTTGTLAYLDGHLGRTAPVGIGPSELDFRWAAHDPATTHVMWQVSAVPPPPGPALDFPGLLAWQQVAGAAGEVTIDVDAIWTGEVTAAPAVTWAQLDPGAVGVTLDPADVAVPADDPATESPVWQLDTGSVADDLPLPPPSAYYVRVVPMAAATPLAHPSAPVTFGIGPAATPGLAESPPPPTGPSVADTQVTFYPPGPPNPAYARCVRVVENPHGSANPAPVPLLQSQYDQFTPIVGTAVCSKYDPPETSWFDAVVSAIGFVTGVWDDAVAFLGELKAKVVELAASLGCKQLEDEVAKADSSVSGVCEKAIGTAIDVYLAANGVPPTLPTSADVTAAGKGKVAQLVADKVAEQCPGAATEICREEARQLTEELIDRIQDEVSDSTKAAAAAGDWKLYLADDIVVVPEPAGQFRPAMFEVAVELSEPAAEDTKICFTGRVRGGHPAWPYRKPVSASSIANVIEPIAGPVMVPASGVVLVPAGSTTATGVIALPHLDRDWHPTPSDHWNSDPFWWAWFDQDAEVTMSLYAGCDYTGFGTPVDQAAFGPLTAPAGPEEVALP